MSINNLSILYAEDDKQLRTQYSKLLKQYIPIIYEADDGKTALEIYKKYKPPIAILDINMPRFDGLEVAKQIRYENKDAILIMLTGYSEKEMLLEALDLHVNKYLIKPIKIFDLESVMKKSIQEIKKDSNILLLSGGFKWHLQENELYDKDDKKIKLTKKELMLLQLFCTNKNNLFSNNDIINYIWDNNDENNNYNKLRILFSKLKTKLSHNLFQSIYSSGYKLDL